MKTAKKTFVRIVTVIALSSILNGCCCTNTKKPDVEIFPQMSTKTVYLPTQMIVNNSDGSLNTIATLTWDSSGNCTNIQYTTLKEGISKTENIQLLYDYHGSCTGYSSSANIDTSSFDTDPSIIRNYIYDEHGNIVCEEIGQRKAQYFYNSFGQLESTLSNIGTTYETKIDYVYDSSGNLIRATASSQLTSNLNDGILHQYDYQYDRQHRLLNSVKKILEYEQKTYYKYDDSGRITKILYTPNDSTESMDAYIYYDRNNCINTIQYSIPTSSDYLELTFSYTALELPKDAQEKNTTYVADTFVFPSSQITNPSDSLKSLALLYSTGYAEFFLLIIMLW